MTGKEAAREERLPLAGDAVRSSSSEPTGFTVWLTGLSGAGKSTIAALLADRLRAGGRCVVVLDGDEVRSHLSPELGFDRRDRDVQVLRVGWLCRLLSTSGVVAIAALVSPYRAAREQVRAAIGRFVEVYVEAPLDVVQARDTKGLYRRAAAGLVAQLTGVDDPYEPPIKPDVHCFSDDAHPPDESVEQILAHLVAAQYLDDGDIAANRTEEPQA
jgi:adenylylsulfate kinase